MPFRCVLATRIQSLWRGYVERRGYFPDLNRNMPGCFFLSRGDFVRQHYGVEWEADDCLDRGGRHNVAATVVPIEEYDVYSCDWCFKDIDVLRWSCRQGCDFDLCQDCAGEMGQGDLRFVVYMHAP